MPDFEGVFNRVDNLLRQEAGCANALDYTEQTSWLLFLKYLDDLEEERALEAELEGRKYEYILKEYYRWSCWAAPKDDNGEFDHDLAMNGNDLIEFVNDKLFPYLQDFKGRIGYRS